MARALVLDGHSRAAIETVQSLGRRGIEVDLAAEESDALGFRSSYTRRHLLQPRPHPQEALVEWLRELDRGENYRLIVPATEASLPALARLPESDPLRGKAVLAGAASLEIALDKERTAALARALAVPVPEGRLIRGLEEAGGDCRLPVVLKPVKSKVLIGDRLVTLAATIVRKEEARKRQLDRWLPLTPVLQQEYVSGWGVGIEMLYDRGRMRWAFAHQRLHEMPLTGGASTYRKSIELPEEALQSARRLLDELSWHGVAMVEFKGTPGGTQFLMEINPRLWGSLALSCDAGIDFPFGLWLLAGGESPGGQPRYRRGRTTRYVPEDLQWMAANWKANHADPLLLTRPRLRAMAEWLRPLAGKESWDHWDWRDLRLNGSLYGRTLSRHGESLSRKLRQRRWAGRARTAYQELLARRRPFEEPIRTVLFLCLGNICRSPFAATWARPRLPGVTVESGGLGSTSDRPSPAHVVRVAGELGLSLAEWRSSAVSRDQIARADLIVVMDLDNYEAVARRFPESLERTIPLGLFAPGGGPIIPDPYNAGEEETRRIYSGMLRALEGLAASLRRTAN